MTSRGVVVVLVSSGGRRFELTPEQRERLFARYPDLAREASKWRAITGRDGRLRVIDEAVVTWALDTFGADRDPE